MHWFLKLRAESEDDFLEELSDCLKVVQKRLWSASSDTHYRMGTTVTLAYVLWPKLFLVHAGDSRCYLLRSGQLRQLTTDHTLAQQMIECGAGGKDNITVIAARFVDSKYLCEPITSPTATSCRGCSQPLHEWHCS